MASPVDTRPASLRSAGAPIKVSSLEAFQELLKQHEDVVVFAYKKYCPYCAHMRPIFENISKAPSHEDVLFVRVDLSNPEEVGVRYNVTRYPTIVYFLRGREVVRFNGSRKQEELEVIYVRQSIQREQTDEAQIHYRAESHYARDGHYCQGMYEDRTSKLAIFSNRKEPFNDLEPKCIIRPKAANRETRTQIARANEGKAHFTVYVWNKPVEAPGKVFFRLDFMNEGPAEDRFESAMFQVTFGHDDTDDTRFPIKIADVFPTSAEQLVSHTVFDADLGIDASMGSEEDADEARRKEETFISGQGQHSPTATWNFVEADGQGLDSQYTLSVTLPVTNKIWMKFYGKAVHIRGRGLALGRKRVIIQVGSLEKPYERILDLTEVI
ncbi:unnamed protein product [Cyclocybe aegerita]|uniref:Thioredoxin domain-containing protein n=1 Tax=Cyclocybe aegerita TaxID=1973307 RepID=A0A8S0VVL6_CYCAE|nr:unnamed protein product [Cyclocybe aegerita]